MQTNQADIKVQDAIANSWVDRYAPLPARSYLRLSRMDRPVGSWLLFYPCVVGAAAAGMIYGTDIGTLAHLLLVCLVGAWLMRGAGCTWNDIVDRKIDAQVERTKSRPLPSGAVTVRNAVIWMAAQALIAFLFLITLSTPTILVTMASLLVVAIYPFAKRFTNWPQVVLGFAFNWGVITAWMEIAGRLDVTTAMLYAGFISFTLFYDSIYAFQDIEDDAIVGVKSSAQQIASAPIVYLRAFAIGFLAPVLIVSVSATLDLSLVGRFFVIVGVIDAGYRMIRILRDFDANDTQIALKLFRDNVTVARALALWWLVALVSHLLLNSDAALVITG